MLYPKVSIMIPTYNQAKFISEAVLSALHQDYSNIEILISDDCSSDNTKEIVEEIIRAHPGKDIRYIRNEFNIGSIRNYHKTLTQEATGDYVLNLDGDDFLTDSTYITTCINKVLKNPDMKLVFACQATYFQSSNITIYDSVNKNLPPILDGNKLFMMFPKGYSIPHLTCFYERKTALSLGFYTKNIISSDWESVLRIMINHKVGFVKRYVGTWRKHQNNESRSINVEKIIKNLDYIDSVLEFAEQSQAFTQRQLCHWKKRMVKRNLIRDVILLTYTDIKLRNSFLTKLKEYNTEYYHHLLRDPAYYGAKLVCKSEFLMKFLFTYLLKQPSMLEDLFLFS